MRRLLSLAAVVAALSVQGCIGLSFGIGSSSESSSETAAVAPMTLEGEGDAAAAAGDWDKAYRCYRIADDASATLATRHKLETARVNAREQHVAKGVAAAARGDNATAASEFSLAKGMCNEWERPDVEAAEQSAAQQWRSRG
jgi:hypothetical protein